MYEHWNHIRYFKFAESWGLLLASDNSYCMYVASTVLAFSPSVISKP